MSKSRWSTRDITILKKLYGKLSLVEIADLINKTENSTRKKATRLGLRMPVQVRPVDHRAFSVETPDVAYWAGFMMADGNVNQRTRNRVRVQLHLAQQDRDHLTSFAKFIGHTGAITETKSGGVMMSVNSHLMAEDLRRWGVVPRKTKDGSVPEDITGTLVPHYMRGLIDGDGGVYIFESAGRTRWSIALTNNEAVVTSVAEVLQQTLGIKAAVRRRRNGKTGHSTHVLNIGAKGDVAKVLLWLGYDGDGPWLPRKRATAMQIIEDSAGDRQGPTVAPDEQPLGCAF